MPNENDKLENIEKEKEAFLSQARKRAVKAISFWQPIYSLVEDDLLFLFGEQWPEKIRKQRELEGRPCLTLNELPQYVDQVMGNQRQNRPSIKISPVESDGQEEESFQGIAGTNDYSQADVYESLLRNIEYASNASTHYDRAFQHAIEGGIGWLRVLTKYSNDDVFDLDISITSIKNRFSVLTDPMAEQPDYSDMNYCFVGEKIPRAKFLELYGSKRLGDLNDLDRGEYSWWIDDDSVRVAEYFYREPAKRTLLLLKDLRTVWKDEVEDALEEMASVGITVVQERKVDTHIVKWKKITAHDVLEEEKIWPGTTIPIVPVLGKEDIIGDKTILRGLIRFAKEPSRMNNFWMSAATERVALAPKAPFIGTAEAIEGHENDWENANIENKALLKYNEGHDKPSREQPAPMPAAELQLATQGRDLIKSAIGLYQNNLGQQGSETSGKAILAKERQGDTGTYSYVDNLNRAISRIGKICVEIIPKTYDGERIIRVRFKNGEGDWLKINETVKGENGEDVLINDMAAGKFDVVVSSGPSYQTQRMEAADSLMAFMQAVPDSAPLIADLVANNMDWPGAEEIAERLELMLPPGVKDGDDDENGEEIPQEPPPPTPEQELASKKLDVDSRQADADMATADAKIAEAEAKKLEVTQGGNSGISAEDVRAMVADAIVELSQQQSE